MKGNRVFLAMYDFKAWTRKFLLAAIVVEVITLLVALLAFQVNVSQIVRILVVSLAAIAVVFLLCLFFLFFIWIFGRIFGTILGLAVLVGLAYAYVQFLGRPLVDVGYMLKPFFEFLSK